MGQPSRFTFKNRDDHVARGFSSKGHTACDHLIKHDAQTPEVTTRVYRHTSRLVRGHVTNGAHHDSRIRFSFKIVRLLRTLGQFGQTKIQNLYVPIATKHDVFRFYVTMDYSGGV